MKFSLSLQFFFIKIPIFTLLAVLLIIQGCAYRIGKTGYEIHSAIPLGLQLGDYFFEDPSCVYSNSFHRRY